MYFYNLIKEKISENKPISNNKFSKFDIYKKFKKKLKQIITRLVGEENRAKMSQILNKTGRNAGGGYEHSVIASYLPLYSISPCEVAL